MLAGFFDEMDSFTQRVFRGSTSLWSPLETLAQQLKELFLEVGVSPSENFASEEIYQGSSLGGEGFGTNICLGEGCVVSPGAWLQGPLFLESGCVVSPGALVGPYVWAGAGCSFGHGAEIKRSICFPGASLGHKNYVGDSILGGCINLGAGVVLANLRLDRRPVKLQDFSGHVFYRPKRGAVIGDGAQVGCNSVLCPGTTLAKGVVVYPLQVVKGQRL